MTRRKIIKQAPLLQHDDDVDMTTIVWSIWRATFGATRNKCTNLQSQIAQCAPYRVMVLCLYCIHARVLDCNIYSFTFISLNIVTLRYFILYWQIWDWWYTNSCDAYKHLSITINYVYFIMLSLYIREYVCMKTC